MSDYFEYLEFEFVNPRTLQGKTSSEERDTVLVIGIKLVTMLGDIALAPRKVQERLFADGINKVILNPDEQQKLRGTKYFFDHYIYCALCGSVLSFAGCRRCRIKFGPFHALHQEGVPILPESVYLIALKENLKFKHRPKTRK